MPHVPEPAPSQFAQFARGNQSQATTNVVKPLTAAPVRSDAKPATSKQLGIETLSVEKYTIDPKNVAKYLGLDDYMKRLRGK